MNGFLIFGIIGVVLSLIWLSYKCVPENHMLVVIKRFPKDENSIYPEFLFGGSKFIIPFLESAKLIRLTQYTFDTNERYVTKDDTLFGLSKVISIGISMQQEIVKNYYFTLWGKNEGELENIVREILEQKLASIFLKMSDEDLKKLIFNSDYGQLYNELNSEFNKVGMTVISIRIRK